jgi:hypothetical protein
LTKERGSVIGWGVEEQPIEAAADDLVESGDLAGALKELERTRSVALERRDVPELARVVQLAGMVEERSHGGTQRRARALVYAADENIRFVETQLGVATPREPAPDEREVASIDEVVGGRRGFIGAVFLHMLAAFSWIFFCGGLLVMLALPNDGVAPSELGLILFIVVPASLWLATAGVIVWRWRTSSRSGIQIALPLATMWWIVSALAAYAIAFSV